jgi:hypothetical protein
MSGKDNDNDKPVDPIKPEEIKPEQAVEAKKLA